MTTQSRAAAVCDALIGANAPIAVLAAAVRELPAFEAGWVYARIGELRDAEAADDPLTEPEGIRCEECDSAACDPLFDYVAEWGEFICARCREKMADAGDWSLSEFMKTGSGVL
jgi:hypothetical protein